MRTKLADGIFCFFFLLILLISSNYGCAPGKAYIHKESLLDKEIYLINGVPFYKQIGNTCGPAALASVLEYWGIDFKGEDIVREIYSPRLDGSLDFEISRYAGQFNLWSKYSQEDFQGLREKIKQDIPLIVIQKKNAVLNTHHYIVVFGFDDGEKRVIAHTGEKNFVWIPYSKFLRIWERADSGTVVICPPEKVTWSLDLQGYIYLGYLLEKRELVDKAIEVYLKAISLEPASKIAHFNLGNAYFKKAMFSEAEGVFKKAIELDANFADAYNNLACVYVTQKRNLKEAEVLVKKALELNPKGSQYYLDTLNQINEAQTYGTKCPP